MEIKRKFDCSKCGLCCRLVGMLDEIPEPLECDESGVCIYLDKDTNLCTIYDSRPLICRVDDLYDQVYKDKMSRSNYYKQCHKLCDILMKNNRGNGSVQI